MAGVRCLQEPSSCGTRSVLSKGSLEPANPWSHRPLASALSIDQPRPKLQSSGDTTQFSVRGEYFLA